MEVIETIPSDDHFQLFEAAPGNIYPQDSLRLKQKDGLNLEFLVVCLVVLEREVPIARVAVYYNPNLRYKNDVTACLGNYECIDDSKAATLLLTTALMKIRQINLPYVIGPMNGSTWDNYRFSSNNDYPNFLLEPYHHTFYNDQFKEIGFEEIALYSSRMDKEMNFNDPAILQREKELSDAGVRIRPIDLTDFERELKRLYPFVKNAFQSNFLYSPIEWESFSIKYLEAKSIIDPAYVLIAEDDKQNLIGFLFAYQNRYNQTEKELVVKTIARSNDKQWTSLGHVMGNQVVETAKKNGFTAVIQAFMIQEGTSTAISHNFNGTDYKSYTLYGRKA